MILKYIILGTLSYRNFYTLNGISLCEIYGDSDLKEFLNYDFNTKYKLHDKVYLVYTDDGKHELEADSALELIKIMKEGMNVRAIAKRSYAQPVIKESNWLTKG
ncbi:hypothetical protein Cyrtocomes_00002 [Candidatus Cyrtobacter comes]|uniref:Uncharacterized protein n=1 Tax=Candidatus Cyrtobacter comes TaxID=675776 RepID=A0ABU5L6G7_9RICK|nr:hypothetical protein [Candidatus Cyrtobacter comes]MDZ5761647.1 hypothetical protein [Candidatus Cyrtobacter comes]